MSSYRHEFWIPGRRPKSFLAWSVSQPAKRRDKVLGRRKESFRLSNKHFHLEETRHNPSAKRKLFHSEKFLPQWLNSHAINESRREPWRAEKKLSLHANELFSASSSSSIWLESFSHVTRAMIFLYYFLKTFILRLVLIMNYERQ